MEKTHCCSQCRGSLVTVWDGEADTYRLVCGIDHSHQGYQSILTPSQALARGELGKSLGDNSQADLEKMAKQGAPALSKLPDRDLGSGELIARDKFLGLMDWATRLTLQPHLGHVCLYYSQPYVTIDGYYYLLGKRKPEIAIGTRPMNVDERTAYQLGDQDYGFKSEAWEGNIKLPWIGIGIVTIDELTAKSPRHPEQFRAPVVHGHPQRMAEKRAEWQLLRKLIPLEEQE